MELISVIVPVYNVEKYLNQCVESLVTQTYPELEILLIDDESKDNSGVLCDELAARYENVRVIHKSNAGLGMARNTGLENITGEYVTFVDSDDYLQPDAIEKLYEALKAQGVDVCKSGFQRVQDDGTVFYRTDYADEVFPGIEAKNGFAPRLLGSRPDKKDSLEMCVCGVLYSAKPIRENALRFLSEREILSEDLPFNLEYLQFANGACTVSYIGYNYRTNPASLTKSYRPDRFERSVYFFKTMSNRLQELGYDALAQMRLHRLFFVYAKMCVAQERRAVSGHSAKQSRANIRGICKDNYTMQVIADYPAKYLGVKQRLFVYMLRFRMAWLLYVFANRGLI